MGYDLNTMVERMSVQSLHEMHDALWDLMVARAGDEAELISRNQAVARYQY